MEHGGITGAVDIVNSCAMIERPVYPTDNGIQFEPVDESEE